MRLYQCRTDSYRSVSVITVLPLIAWVSLSPQTKPSAHLYLRQLEWCWGRAFWPALRLSHVQSENSRKSLEIISTLYHLRKPALVCLWEACCGHKTQIGQVWVDSWAQVSFASTFLRLKRGEIFSPLSHSHVRPILHKHFACLLIDEDLWRRILHKCYRTTMGSLLSSMAWM